MPLHGHNPSIPRVGCGTHLSNHLVVKLNLRRLAATIPEMKPVTILAVFVWKIHQKSYSCHADIRSVVKAVQNLFDNVRYVDKTYRTG
jgi:hypothetical protein